MSCVYMTIWATMGNFPEQQVYSFDFTKAQWYATHLTIDSLQELLTLKMFFLARRSAR